MNTFDGQGEFQTDKEIKRDNTTASVASTTDITPADHIDDSDCDSCIL